MSDTTHLLDAFRNNNFQEAKVLLENKDNIPDSLKEFERIQLFDRLIRNKAFDIILLFQEHKLIETDIYEYESFKNTLLENIFRSLSGDEASIRFFNEFLSKLENINDEVQDQTLLGYALEEGAAIEVIQCLIKAGCDVNYTNNAEQNYLHQLTANNRINPERANELLNLLIAEGVNVNATDVVGKTPLIVAISRNKTAMIERLLENNAGCNEQDKSGETAFYNAIVHLNDFTLYQKLRAAELPDFNKVTKNGETILFEFLRRLSRPNDTTLNLLIQMIEDGADLLQPSMWYGKEKTPLAVVAEKSFDVFSTVLSLDKVDVNSAYEQGNTLLHLVCAFNINFDKDQAKDTYRKVKLLIEKGADVNMTNNLDETPMTLASNDNLKIKTVELLLSHSKS